MSCLPNIPWEGRRFFLRPFQARSQDFSERGSKRLLTRSPSGVPAGDRRLYMVYTAAFPRVSAGSVVLSRHEEPLTNILYKKTNFKKVFFNNGFYGQDIVMAFSPPEYCRLFTQKKAYQGGFTGTPGPPPSYAPAFSFQER